MYVWRAYARNLWEVGYSNRTISYIDNAHLKYHSSPYCSINVFFANQCVRRFYSFKDQIFKPMDIEYTKKFFLPLFFPDSNPPRLLKYFRKWFRFRGDIRMCKNLCGIIDTAAESDMFCVLFLKSRNLQHFLPRFKLFWTHRFYGLKHLFSGVQGFYDVFRQFFKLACWLRGVRDTPASDSEFYITSRSQNSFLYDL